MKKLRNLFRERYSWDPKKDIFTTVWAYLNLNWKSIVNVLDPSIMPTVLTRAKKLKPSFSSVRVKYSNMICEYVINIFIFITLKGT